MPNTFVSAKSEIPTSGSPIQENEIGIVKSRTAGGYLVNFVVGNREVEVARNDVQEFDPKQTGDQRQKKVCNVCHRLLDTEEFEVNQTGVGDRQVRRPSCRACRRVIEGTPLSASEKARWEESKPDMEIFECPICHKITVPGLTSKVVLDHDHTTGKARGWVCDSCNTGIGRFKDDPNLLASAQSFLRKHS